MPITMTDFTRVTECLYHFSGLSKINPEILANACKRGTIVHSICDAIIEGIGTGEIFPECEGYILSFKSWVINKKFIPKPARFYDNELMLTGECDAIYEEDGKLVVVDFKTSAKESKTWSLQGSAYMHLAKICGYEISRIEFIKLDKGGKKAKTYIYDHDFETFHACLKVYRHFYKQPEELCDTEFL